MSDDDDVEIDVFVGVDVGKTGHHAVALNRVGKVILDRPVPQDEKQIIEMVETLQTHGQVLFVVDQPAT